MWKEKSWKYKLRTKASGKKGEERGYEEISYGFYERRDQQRMYVS